MPADTADTAPPPAPADLVALGEELADATRALRRATRRAVAAALAQPALPLSQVEVLRVVAERPGVGVSEVADALSLAVNTVSTIVGHLVGTGLLRRERGLLDRRTVELHLTPRAEERLAGWRHHRAEVVSRALDGLGAADRDALEAAVPALLRLAAVLEAGNVLEAGRVADAPGGGRRG